MYKVERQFLMYISWKIFLFEIQTLNGLSKQSREYLRRKFIEVLEDFEERSSQNLKTLAKCPLISLAGNYRTSINLDD